MQRKPREKHGHSQTSLRRTGTVRPGHSGLDHRGAQLKLFVRRTMPMAVSEVEQEIQSEMFHRHRQANLSSSAKENGGPRLCYK